MKQKGVIVAIFLSFVVLAGLKILRGNNINNIKTNDRKAQTVTFGKNIPCKNCNVILISVEPLRTENMSLYGYSRETTPNLDKFSENALVFGNFISVSPWTLPAHMSLFTGVYPSKHKITNKIGLSKDGKEFENSLTKVSPNLKTMTQLLKDNGYATAGFTGGAADAASFGFDLGFDKYADKGDFVGLLDNISQAEQWLDNNKSNKFFLFFQGYDVHGQYIPEGGYDKRFVDFDYKGDLTGGKVEQKDLREEGITRGEIFLTPEDTKFLEDIYDEKVQRMDETLGGFIDYLENNNLLKNTIVIFLSGHGDEFYEHGRIDHGHSLYEELIHVPLVIKVPGLSQQIKVKGQFSILDVMPTIFDLIGETDLLPDNLDGKSIISSLKNGIDDESVFLETDYRYSVFLRGLRTDDGWKIIKNLETGQTQLFDLSADTSEKTNLSFKSSEKFEELSQDLNKYLNNY